MANTRSILHYKLIGLGYQAGAGKDTVAQMLNTMCSYQRISFGDQVRKVVSILCDEDAFDRDFKTNLNRFGLTGGEILQLVGEGMRQAVSPLVWVTMSDLHGRVLSGERLVVSDVRYRAEADFIKAIGGLLINVKRPGLRHDSHVSETEGAQIDWDITLLNDGSISDLADKLVRLVEPQADSAPDA